MKKINILLATILLIGFIGCSGRHSGTDRKNGEHSSKNDSISKIDDEQKIDSNLVNNSVSNIHVHYYIENSASMFGYVNGQTEYVSVLSELSSKNEFIDDDIERLFYFVNGHKPLSINFIGSSKEGNVLLHKLNKKSYDIGKVGTSDLNEMFQIAIDTASDKDISILISDGIYDIKGKDTPRNDLITEGQFTKEKFIKRLDKINFQTIVIKLLSGFNGKYYYLTKYIGKRQKSKYIHQKRPYYVWIFGKSELLNKYFRDEYIQSLEGYQNMVRFLKLDKINLPYEPTTKEKIGRFDFDRHNKKMLTGVSVDRRKKVFQFSFYVDYSGIPFPDSYLTNVGNYMCSNDNFKVSRVVPVKDNRDGYTHLITLTATKSPYGKLKVSLKNVLPEWIDNTDPGSIENDDIEEDKTFGFKYLMKGINDAYTYKNQNQYITSFEFILTN